MDRLFDDATMWRCVTQSHPSDIIDGVLYAVAPVAAQLAASVVVAEHYLHRKPSISYSYGLYREGELVGVCTFGTPASRQLQISACRTNPELVLELNRLWVHDDMPHNSESWFVSRSLRMLPPSIVVSYADTAHGHVGYIYRALSFRYAGWTDMERKTPRYDYIPLDPKAHTREAFRSGWSHRVQRKPKVKYWTVTGSHGDRRRLAKLCTWPSYDWRTLPPAVAAA